MLICNPTLVQTGLDLIYFPTLIFYEITFNLSTMMQAAARSYRLNQTHTLCKVYYLFYEATMEQTAVQLMSRKQRAAKLLTGDIGLTGLDALTEGEGGLEEALLAAIGRDEALLDPSELFKADSAQGAIDAEDAAFWNVEVSEAAPTTEVELTQALPLTDDPLMAMAVELGAVVHPVEAGLSVRQPEREDDTHLLERSIGGYLDNVHIIADSSQYAKLQAKLLIALTEGVPNDDGKRRVLGMRDPDFTQTPTHEATLTHWARGWLKEQRLVFTGCEAEVAEHIISLAKHALGMVAGQSENGQVLNETSRDKNAANPLPQKAMRKPASKPVKRKFNLLALPDELAETPSSRPLTAPEELAVQQLALF